MPWSFSRLFVCPGPLRQRDARLVDEVEGAYHLVATRFDAHLALHTSVVLRAAAYGIDTPRWEPRELGEGVHPLCARSEEHTSELQSRQYLVCRLLLEKKKIKEPLY